MNTKKKILRTLVIRSLQVHFIIVARIKYLEFGQVSYNLTISWAGRGNWGNRAVMGLGYYRYIATRLLLLLDR